MPLIRRYRSPQEIEVQKAQEKEPKAISMVGAGRGGALIAFVEAQKAGMANGR